MADGMTFNVARQRYQFASLAMLEIIFIPVVCAAIVSKIKHKKSAAHKAYFFKCIIAVPHNSDIEDEDGDEDHGDEDGKSISISSSSASAAISKIIFLQP